MSSDFYTSKLIRAHKEHECEGLNLGSPRDPHRYRKCTIRTGERYWKIAQVFDGNFSTSVLCRKHAAMVQVAFAAMDAFDTEYGIDYRYVRERLIEDMSGTGREGWLRMLRELRDEMRKAAK